MQIEDQITVDAPRDVVIEEMRKPEVLEKVIPNCESVTQTGEYEYDARVNERIARISLDMELSIEISEFDPPDHFVVAINGSGIRSNTQAEVEAEFELTEADDERTIVDLDIQIEVQGKLASLGFRMLQSTVKKKMDQMVENIENAFSETTEAT